MYEEIPQPVCEVGLHVAVDGVSQFSPDVTVTVHTNGDTRVEISGSIRASYDTLVKGQGSCSYTLTRGIPEKPATKVICAGKFCISAQTTKVNLSKRVQNVWACKEVWKSFTLKIQARASDKGSQVGE